MSENIIEKFAKRFKQLNKGIIRLLIVTWVVILLLGLAMNPNESDLGVILIVLFIFYWFIIRIVLWIKDGFNEDVKPID
ncbi:MAG: hypothetical protein U0T69_09235 [Chitinophagales bacterium]